MSATAAHPVSAASPGTPRPSAASLPPHAGDVEVSVVMPCLNENLTLGACVREAHELIRQLGVSGEVIVADNGSTDGSQQTARELGARLIEVPRRGYGAALIAGCTAARGRYIIMADSDASYNFLEGKDLVRQLQNGFELVMGSRFKGRILPGAMPWKNRYIGNPLLTGMLNLFFDSGLSDAHSGLRGFTKQAFNRMELRCPGMEFASEMVVKAALLDLKRTEVPVTLRPDGRNRPPHLNPWRDGWRHMRFLLLYAPRWLYVIPGLVLLIVGAAMALVLNILPTPVNLLGIPFGDHWMIPATLASSLGVQSVFLGVFMHAYSAKAGLYPHEKWLQTIARQFTLERGVLIGLGISLIGVVILGAILIQWVTSSFGALSQLKTGVFGMLWVMIGAQVLLNSFLLSLMLSDVRASEFERASATEVRVPPQVSDLPSA